MNRLILIDGNAILHRAYHALPQWRNKEGEATSGVYGFFSMLLKVRDELKPKYLAVVFDHPSPTFRHVAYVGYQHGRTKDRQTEEDIWGQVEKLKEHLAGAGMAVFQVEGFEADDVIGTLASQASDRKFEIRNSKFEINEVIIVTGDRDLLQLVDKKIKVFMPVKGLSETALLDKEGVYEKMGVWPQQIVDYKGLVGDASDNYPGVPGIGPKTAVQLVKEYDTLDNVYKHLKKLNETVAKKLVEGQEGAVLSRQLAEIRKDVPVTFELDQTKMPNDEKLVWLFGHMNYPSLIKRITGESEMKFKTPALPVGRKVKPKTKGAEGQMELV